jgi:mannose-1-phosphate guanylyltransferase
MKNTYAVIMAGGGGTRLWPISRQDHPKHTLPLLGEETLFQSTLERLKGLVPVDRIFVVTTADQVASLQRQAPRIPNENFLPEPEPRGTASVMLVLPSDHFIRNQDQFHRIMRVADKVARQGFLVTLGIQPAFASTGYGYIQQGEALAGGYDYPVYHVVRFIEKPNESLAQKLIASGDHSWNSGMFIWRADRILAEISRQMPALAKALQKIGSAWGEANQMHILQKEWVKLVSETVDFGIMENARDVIVLPVSDLGWSDVGSWDSLFDVLTQDNNGNVCVNSDHLPLDTHASVVYTKDKKLVVTIGVDNLVVIDSGDALLVCHRKNAQQVRLAIEKMKKTNREHYL